MKEFTCYFSEDDEGNYKYEKTKCIVEAEESEQAAILFLRNTIENIVLQTPPNLYSGPQTEALIIEEADKIASKLYEYILVSNESYTEFFWSKSFGVNIAKEIILNRSKIALEKEQIERDKQYQKHFEHVSKYIQMFDAKSYFSLSPSVRITLTNFFNQIVSDFENRHLTDVEIEFVTKWSSLSGRELGEKLLCQKEMSRPKEEQGKTEWGRVIAQGVAVMGFSNMVNSIETNQLLDDIADEISDIGEDIGGFE